MSAFYLAASYNRRDEMQRHARVLKHTYGHAVASTWQNLERKEFAAEELATMKGTVAAESHALRDFREIRGCNVLLLFTQESSGGKGGSSIEFGYAFAASKQIHVIGPRRNVFHAHPGIAHWADWDAFVEGYLSAPSVRQAPAEGT